MMATPGVTLSTALLVVLFLANPNTVQSLFQPSEGRTLPSRRSLKTPGLDVESICKRTYTVSTWDGHEVPVCDTAVCDGADKLGKLTISKRQRRWSAAQEEMYLDMADTGKVHGKIHGWMHKSQLDYLRAFTAHQHKLGIFGTVGEIGVHHGKFFMPIAGYADAAEPALAIDLFESLQADNIDKSGRGSSDHFVKHLKKLSMTSSNVQLVAGNSMMLTAGNFSRRGLPAFRLLSVDGGHTTEITLHDMMLASCVLQDGGIMVVDDVHGLSWYGVTEALNHFMSAQTRLIPILMGYNKGYFVTASHVKEFRQLIADNPDVFQCMPDSHLHPSRHVLGGSVFCFTGLWP